MSHERALALAADIVDIGLTVEVTLSPALPSRSEKEPATEAHADVRIPLRIIGRRLTVGRLDEISRLLADHDAAGDLDGDFIRVIA